MPPKRYENELRVIFDQWPKLKLGFDVEPEIRILKVIYCTVSASRIYFLRGCYLILEITRRLFIVSFFLFLKLLQY